MKRKKLYRSRKNRVVLGVCGGLGEYFEVDPVLIRVIFAFLALADGFGLLFYLVLAIIVPLSPGGEEISKGREIEEAAEDIKEKSKGLGDEIKEGFDKTKKSWLEEKKNLVAVLFILVGILFTADRLLSVDILRWNLVWPVILVALGFYLLFKNEEKNE